MDVPNLVAACFGLPAIFPRRPRDTVFATGITEQFGAVWERAIPQQGRAYQSALIAGNRKYVLAGDDFELMAVYDLDSDPGETRNVASREDAVRARELVRPFVGNGGMAAGADSVEEDERLREALRALGYVD